MFNGLNLAFIGTGNMAEAMIRGLIAEALVEPNQIIGSNPLIDRNEYMQERHGIRVTHHNLEAVHDADVVVLCVKPQFFKKISAELQGRIKTEALVVSIIAGMPIQTIAAGLLHGSIARSMPNTPAQIGEGITVWTETDAVTEAQHRQAIALFSSLGKQVFVEEESYLDMATALSGSGPGYIFLMMESMIDAGVHMGFSRRIAEELVFQTIIGSVKYAEQSGKHVAELRNQVTSPGGTTAEALYHMEKRGFRTVISRGIFAAYERSVALGNKQ
jgi:pyrroline-5-carboxylate reductase